ncbi:MAG: GxxExxY protein [Lentimicrobium sp.]|nr:GxxExxY protein [Lentimicrobium sp.]
MNRAELNKLHTRIFDSANEVYSELGPGLDQNLYYSCFQHELRLQGLMFKKDVYFPVFYKNLKTSHNIKADILIENQVIVELISEPLIAASRLITMQSILKIAEKRMGIILTFNAPAMIEGYRKVIVSF